MNNVALADTGPLLHLVEIQQESLLSIFPIVYVTTEIEAELLRLGVLALIRKVLSSNLHIMQLASHVLPVHSQEGNTMRLPPADRSVIILANQIKPDILLCDDLFLRRIWKP